MPEATEAPRTRGPRKREKTRRHLVAAGLRVLAVKGEGLTVSDVVAEADVSNGTFYNDFVDRDSLLDALAEQLALSLAAATARAPVPDPARRFALATAADASIDQVEGLVIMTLRRIVVGRARADATERAVERALRALGVGAEEAAAIAAETVDSCAAETADL